MIIISLSLSQYLSLSLSLSSLSLSLLSLSLRSSNFFRVPKKLHSLSFRYSTAAAAAEAEALIPNFFHRREKSFKHTSRCGLITTFRKKTNFVGYHLDVWTDRQTAQIHFQ